MTDTVSDLARRLAGNAEAVCRHYLSNGRRHGRYWLVGRCAATRLAAASMSVCAGPASGQGAAGKWTDAATGEHGDLLDLIAAALRLAHARATRWTRHALPRPAVPAPGQPILPGAAPDRRRPRGGCSPWRSRSRARWPRPICARAGSRRLRDRERAALSSALLLPPGAGTPDGARRGLAGADRGRHRPRRRDHRRAAHLARPARRRKAPVATPRRAMGQLLGHAVRFGDGVRHHGGRRGHRDRAVAAGALPTMPLAAALSAGHLAALLPPSGLRRLYIVRDNDPAGQLGGGHADRPGAGGRDRGDRAGAQPGRLQRRSAAARPRRARGGAARQLAPEDVARFWRPPERGRTG